MKQIARDNRFGYVYIIEGTHEGVTKHKIGKANNLRDRVSTFNVKLPFDIRVVASFYVLNAREFEGELHTFMKAKRIAGEWFDLTPDDIRRLCLLGVSREARDLSRSMDKILDAVNRKRLMPDAEYIEYLESLLVIRNIPFSREVKDYGATIETD
jgi:hypothetical protein